MQKTILIVDSDDGVRSRLNTVLLANNFKTLEAVDGSIALEAIERHHPDLVLLDFSLPKVSGETVCVKIKKDHPDIIVIALTDKSSSEDVIHGLHIGADDYITKPFVIEEVVARIDARLKTIVTTPSEPIIPSATTSSEIDTAIIHDSAREVSIEKVVLRESMVLTIIRFIFTEGIFGVLLFLLSILFSYLNSLTITFDLSPLYATLLIAILMLNICMIILTALRRSCEYTEISREGVVKHSGILHRKEQTYACNFVEGAKLSQSFLGMIFNYGTIELYDPALKEQVYLLNISDPKINSKKVQDIVSKEEDKPMPFIANEEKIT